jgi:anti-sigma regulatory factor (Ser/Thr protein kinase)
MSLSYPEEVDERVGASGPGGPSVDAAVRRVLDALLERRDVVRAGLALVEGAGRRLWFTSSDRIDIVGGDPWCLVDAYDDVPLATVVRTGVAILAEVDGFAARYPAFAAQQRSAGIVSVAVVPVPGRTGPVGGIVVYFAQLQEFDPPLVDALAALAREVAAALESRMHAPVPDPRDGASENALVAVTMVGGDPRAARVARQFLREELAAWEVGDELGDVAVLCLSELVTNAVMHTGTPSQLRVTLGADVLTLAVRDHGSTAPEVGTPVADADPLSVHGRGLQVIDALARRWGVERDDAGTTVWVELDRVAG